MDTDIKIAKNGVRIALLSILRELKIRLVEKDGLSAKRRENLRKWIKDLAKDTDPEIDLLVKSCLGLLDAEDKEIDHGH